MLALSLLLLHSIPHGRPEPLGAPSSQGDRTVYNVSVLLMERIVDDAEPADEQPGLALEFDMYTPASIIGWELGVSTSSDDADVPGFGEFEATIDEIYGGVRKTWGVGRNFHPYLGGGLSFIKAEAEVSGLGSEDDTTFGGYVHGGAYWTFGQHFNLGADLKAVLGTDLDFGDADYVQAGLVLGYSI